MIIIQHLKRVWKLKGAISVKSDEILFLFNLSCEQDRKKIIESDQIIMRNKLFIINPWDPSIGNGCSTIKSVPVWLKFANIPLYSWSHLGINWLASRLGRLLCMDESTDKMERIGYDKCMVEVVLDTELLNEFPAKLLDGTDQMVQVSYLWKPKICIICKEFGRLTTKCLKMNHEEELKERVDYQVEMKQSVQKRDNEVSRQPVKMKQVWKKVQYKRGTSANDIGKKTSDDIASTTGKDFN